MHCRGNFRVSKQVIIFESYVMLYFCKLADCASQTTKANKIDVNTSLPMSTNPCLPYLCIGGGDVYLDDGTRLIPNEGQNIILLLPSQCLHMTRIFINELF